MSAVNRLVFSLDPSSPTADPLPGGAGNRARRGRRLTGGRHADEVSAKGRGGRERPGQSVGLRERSPTADHDSLPSSPPQSAANSLLSPSIAFYGTRLRFRFSIYYANLIENGYGHFGSVDLWAFGPLRGPVMDTLVPVMDTLGPLDPWVHILH